MPLDLGRLFLYPLYVVYVATFWCRINFSVQMEMIVMGEDGTASSTALLRTVPTLERKLSHREAQEFLKSLVRDKWLKEEVRRKRKIREGEGREMRCYVHPLAASRCL